MVDNVNPYESDNKLAEKLKEGDNRAWEYVFLKAALPVMRRKNVSMLMYDRQLSEKDVYGILYENMLVNNNLSKYRGEGSLLGWIKLHVFGLIHNYCKKNPYPVSDEMLDNSYYNRATDPHSLNDDWELVQKCFRNLWQDNPMRAYIHLLKVRYGMSATAIKDLLNVSSEDNVNQLFSRALKDMKGYREKYEN